MQTATSETESKSLDPSIGASLHFEPYWSGKFGNHQQRGSFEPAMTAADSGLKPISALSFYDDPIIERSFPPTLRASSHFHPTGANAATQQHDAVASRCCGILLKAVCACW